MLLTKKIRKWDICRPVICVNKWSVLRKRVGMYSVLCLSPVSCKCVCVVCVCVCVFLCVCVWVCVCVCLRSKDEVFNFEPSV